MVPNAGLGRWVDEEAYHSADEDPYISADEGEFGSLGRSRVKIATPGLAAENGANSDRSRGKNEGGAASDENFQAGVLKLLEEDSAFAEWARRALQAKVEVKDEMGHREPKIRDLPKLTELVQLQMHLDLCEEMLLQDRVDLDRTRTKVAVAESFGTLVDLKDTAKSLARIPWREFRHTLVADFCDVNFMRAELEAKLKKLKFKDSARMTFVHEVRRLWALRTPDIEPRWFVTQVFRVVPDDLTQKVIGEALRRNRTMDWRSTDMRLLLTLLSEAIVERTSLEAVKGTSNDRVAYAREGQAPRRDVRASMPRPAAVKGPNVSQWIEQRKGRVFYVRKLEPSALDKLKHVASEVLECTRAKDGEPYILAAFTSVDQGKAALAPLCAEGDFWVFQPKN